MLQWLLELLNQYWLDLLCLCKISALMLKLTSQHIKNEGVIDKWRSVASQGIASLTEIFSCI